MSASASAKPSDGGHLVLILEEELVVLPAGHPVELDPDVGEEGGRALEGLQVGVVGQERRVGRDGSQHADVAQAAVTLLEVGLEQEGHVSRGGSALGHLDLEEWQVLRAEPFAPRGARLVEKRFGHLGLAPDETAIEESERDADVLGGGGEHLGGSAHGVVEVHPLVPDRVPDAVGDDSDVAPAVVDEDHIEVAVGAQGAPPVPAHRHQGQVPLAVAGDPVRQVREPGVGLRGCTPGRSPLPAARAAPAGGSAGPEATLTLQRPWRERSIGSVSKEVERRSDRKPMTFGHAVGMTVLGVVGVLVAYWIFRVLAGVFIFFGEVALVVVLIAAVFWLVSRLRR